ncbi:DMT family transporter [Nocardioides aurantiacus]|uniref:DMT family transporter n=1 Tax=Nocardioides aurantiacus TaxID=86796 RepID=UPI00403F9071
MGPWGWLAAAVVTQWASVLALRLSQGFTRAGWTALALVTTVASIGCVSVALTEGVSLAVAYGLWTGAGVALAVLTGVALFGDRMSRVQVAGVVCVVAGVVALRL